MKDPVKIPDLVLARIGLHEAQTHVRLEEVKAQLDGERLTTTLSRRLRSQRDRLAQELAAWEYLSAHANGHEIRRTLEERFPREESATQAGIEPARCRNCEHPHVMGERCGAVLETESHRVCGCTS